LSTSWTAEVFDVGRIILEMNSTVRTLDVGDADFRLKVRNISYESSSDGAYGKPEWSENQAK